MVPSWWWVVLAVAVGALLLAVVLLRARGRQDGTPPSQVEVAAAAAGGAAGAVGAGAVAAARSAQENRDVDPAAEHAGGGDGAEGAAGDGDAAAGSRDDAGGSPEATAVVDEPRTARPDEAPDSAVDPGEPDEPPAARRPATLLDLAGPNAGTGVAEQLPEPADSALAALDSGLVGPVTPFGAAAAVVSAAGARPGPYPGSLLPAEDGSAPTEDHRVKAHEGARRFHTPDSPYYHRTRADVWFRTAEEARAAGFTPWDAPLTR